MNLPEVKQHAIVEGKLCGYPITLRPITVEDSIFFEEKQKTNSQGMIASNVEALAYLMTGYDEDYEARLKWLKSININTANDIQHVAELLGEAGMRMDEEKSKKK